MHSGEHLLVLASCPTSSCRGAAGRTVAPVWGGRCRRLLAAVGFSLKPYNVLVLLGVEMLVAYRTRLHSLIRRSSSSWWPRRRLLRGGLAVHAGLHQQAHAILYDTYRAI